MLEDDDKVESLDFKSKLDELLERLWAILQYESLKNNKNRVQEALTTKFTRSYLVSQWPQRQLKRSTKI